MCIIRSVKVGDAAEVTRCDSHCKCRWPLGRDKDLDGTVVNRFSGQSVGFLISLLQREDPLDGCSRVNNCNPPHN